MVLPSRDQNSQVESGCLPLTVQLLAQVNDAYVVTWTHCGGSPASEHRTIDLTGGQIGMVPFEGPKTPR